MAKGKYQRWLDPDGLILLEGWARWGLTEEQIAKNCGCSASTLREWKKAFPAISAAIKKGKEVVDLEVENALFKRATGYMTTEVIEELVTDKRTGQSELKVTRRITKEVPPDTTAQIFWLKNRKPDKWRDRIDAPKTFDTTQFERIAMAAGAFRTDMDEDGGDAVE